ncbi:MAG: four helix bundle protein [Verrucomicrobia bacterium]|nr:four helix bundle protein [Verrucomicrobiota bacterium]
MTATEPLIPKHGGYRKLKSFQVAQLVFDITVRFCDRYIDKRSRTHDQMVQAARSGVQNIAEGSQASGTSRKMEMKLTNVARASLEELRLDYEDFLRQREMTVLPADHSALMRFKKKRCATLQDVQAWVAEEKERQCTDPHGPTRTKKETLCGPESAPVGARPCSSLSSAALVANGALSLLNLACHFLDRQIAAQAKAFEEEGGFTERLHRVRSERRRSGP